MHNHSQTKKCRSAAFDKTKIPFIIILSVFFLSVRHELSLPFHTRNSGRIEIPCELFLYELFRHNTNCRGLTTNINSKCSTDLFITHTEIMILASWFTYVHPNLMIYRCINCTLLMNFLSLGYTD